MTSLRLCFFANELNDCHLHKLVHAADLVEVVEKIPHSGWLRDVAEGDKGIALAGGVGFLACQILLLVGPKQRLTAARKVSRSSGASGMRCS